MGEYTIIVETTVVSINQFFAKKV